MASRPSRRINVVVLAVLGLIAASRALAQPTDADKASATVPEKSPVADKKDTSADIERRLRELEQSQQRVKELENTVNRLTQDQRKVEAAVENQIPLAGWLANGFVLNSADGRYKLKLGAYVQSDARFFLDDSQNKTVTEFTVRRARLELLGTVFRYFDFAIVPDFAGSNFELFDAYVETNFVSWLSLRVGKFKPPIGLERLQSATSNMFIERGLPTNLVPDRDNGVQLAGALFDGTLSYQFGVFNGVDDGGNSSSDVNDAKDFAGRVFALPFKQLDIEPLHGIGVGLAGSYGRSRGNSSSADLPSYRSFGQNTFFSYSSGSSSTTAVARGERSRIAPQAYYYFGPLGLLAELTYSNQEVELGSTSGTVNNKSWQVAGSYVLTGESASFQGVEPSSPFDPFEGKWGAVEAVLRGGRLEIDDEAFDDGFANPADSARRATEFVAGANWYLNRNIKFVLNYANTRFKGGGAIGTTGNRETESAIVTRVQLVF